MSRNSFTGLKQASRLLKQARVLQKCQTGLAATAEFYRGVAPLRYAAEIDQDAGVGQMRKLIRVLERVTVAYAPSQKRAGYKQLAQDYADRILSNYLDHPSAPYAHAELRLRQLELLCIDSNLKHGGTFALLSLQREGELHTVADSWQCFFKRHS